jgi:hypothetical protein
MVVSPQNRNRPQYQQNGAAPHNRQRLGNGGTRIGDEQRLAAAA